MKKASRPRVRPGDRVILAYHKSVIPAYDGKPFVGHDQELRVSSVPGTGSQRNPYGVVVTDGEHFWHLLPEDVVPVPEPIAQASPTAAEIERDVDDITGTLRRRR